MRRRHPSLVPVVWAAVLLLGVASIALAQAERGGLYGTVTDNTGEKLPGVTITVSGVGAPQIQTTDLQGGFRFPSLSIGTYLLMAELDGYSTVEHPQVVISASRNTTLEIMLTPALTEVITVTSESPLLDERKLSVGTTVSHIELEKIPTARDPWSVLNQTQGVLVDRINVGGNQSGQQSNFRAPATDRFENDFLVDGVQITDMAATGSSPTYYDFDQFEEMQFSTGGSDITRTSAGVAVNLVTKRGTNEMRGSGRYFLTDANGYFGALDQGSTDVTGDLAPGQESLEGNQIDRIQDYGFEAGGPVIRDRFWLWGSWGRNDIRQFAAGGTPDNTELENSAIKVNAQLSKANSAIGSFNNGDKVKVGRSAGPQRPADTTQNQRGPTGIYKIENTHVFSSSLFVTAAWSRVDGGFQLVSQGQVNAGCGGTACPFEVEPLRDPEGIYRNSYFEYNAKRPAEEWKIDGAYFFNTGQATGHELKFGARLREFETGSLYTWPGRNVRHFAGTNYGFPDGPDDILQAWRGRFPISQTEYQSLWVQDTISLGDWTVAAGFRWDVSDGKNVADSVDANPAFPEELPALDFGGNDGGGVEYDTITPRLGVTYAVGDERDTLLRASFSQFPQALDQDPIQNVNPLSFAIAFYQFEDQNGNNMWEDSEPFTFLFPSGYDPDDPGSLVSPNRNDPGLDPAVTNELVLGAEHAFLPEFVVGANLTFRETTDILEYRRLVRDETGAERVETFGDYVPDGVFEQELPDGTTAQVPMFALRPGVDPTGGYLLTNGDRERSYTGLGVNFTKRLSNQWMLRGYLNYSFEEEWSVPADYLDSDNGPNAVADKSDCDGCTFAMQSSASGLFEDVFLQSGWSWNVNGMYQVAPNRAWGFNVAANLYGREGYPLPYFVSTTGSDGITRDTSVVGDTDDFRVEDVFTADLRLEKEFRTERDVGFTVSLDGFNIFDEAYVLQRERQLNGGRPNYLDETLSPSIWRLGVRINFR